MKSVLRILVGVAVFSGLTCLVVFFNNPVFTHYIAPLTIGLVFMALSMTRLFSRAKKPKVKNKPATQVPAAEPISDTRSETQKAFMAHPATRTLREIIEAKHEENPRLGPALGGKEVYQRIFNGMKANDTRGVHVETLLCILGALAGYACQASVRADAIARGLPENALFMRITSTDGIDYFYGDPLNKPMSETEYSVWGLTAAAAQAAGCDSLPDIGDIFEHTAKNLKGTDFGIPRVPVEHRAAGLPINFLKAFWPAIHPTAECYCLKPSDWPILYGVAIQEAISQAKTVIDPRMAFIIVMETAIPMSKVNIELA
ncbi:hypothetical protein HX870_08605 [Pseudomonas gingeri]|uniref:hypothetical protein n=1 Tax=Pseudomonas gingeri TaxID=117681 RepID=UPI0015A2AD35|nr:hypothetical protein [Pseudomonas gingeri]NWA26136.1 hypothetical protein [Pseudomonas gingeri]NWD67651.1 hypothetical protein [Pseudomonas gingeri]NWD77146.1 hypothetical protein [Pseudomonas gingeri]